MNLPKIPTIAQMKFIDNETIFREPIASVELMERAASCFLSELLEYLHKKDEVLVVCGCGNNGGDGLALSHTLRDMGFSVTVFLIKHGELSEDADYNYKQLDDIHVFEPYDIPVFDDFDIIVDAIFGSGLNRPAQQSIANWIEEINNSDAKVFSIDLPSGLTGDSFNESGKKIKANFTFTFQRPKRSFFDIRSYEYTGEWKVLDIGLDKDALSSLENNHYYINDDVEDIISDRNKHSHKGNFGKGLLIAGSKGMIGAALLAGKSCIKSGVGVLSVMTPQRGENVIQSSIPEALWLDGGHSDYNLELPELSSYSAVGIGPGISTHYQVEELIKKLFKDYNGPLVIDADALNHLSIEPELLDLLPEKAILTPHPKEFERLVGHFENDEEKWSKQIGFSKKHKVVLLVKGAYTSITCPDGNIYWNNNGNPGLATAGSGDVLMGIILSFLAQGYTSLDSALLGCYQHGKAGDIAKEKFGENQMIASDIIDQITF